MGEKHKGDLAEKRSLAHRAWEIYGAQFTYHKIMPILLLLWARLYKEQRTKAILLFVEYHLSRSIA